jgi:hypothetical protein
VKNTKSKPRLIKQIDEVSYEICKICGQSKRTAMYRFRHQQFTSHIPDVLEPVCRMCVYKEVYGSKKFSKKLKERSLDEK